MELKKHKIIKRKKSPTNQYKSLILPSVDDKKKIKNSKSNFTTSNSKLSLKNNKYNDRMTLKLDLSHYLPSIDNKKQNLSNFMYVGTPDSISRDK